MTSSRRVLAWWVCTNLLALAGCKLAGSVAEHEHLEDAAEEYVFTQPLEVVSKEAGIVLEEGGYRLEHAPVVDETVRCIAAETSSTRSWINLRVTERGSGLAVSMHRVGERYGNGAWKSSASGRTSDLEWKLVTRLDPEHAAEVDQQAQVKMEQAEKAGHEIQEGFEELAEILEN